MVYKKVLFIAPATEFGAYPPLGILSVAAYLREKGYEVGVIDYSGLKVSKEQIKKDISLHNPDMDAVIMGEGEYSLEEYLAYLNGSKKEPKGMGIKIKSEIKITPPQDKFVDIETKPMPAWELIKDIDKYFPYSKHNFVLMEANRGCPYRCGFCHHANNDVKQYGGKFRNMSAKRLIEQFDYVKSLTKKHVSRMDIGGDMHLTNEAFTEQFVKEMKESGR